MIKFPFVVFLTALIGCNQLSVTEIQGLWQLEEVIVDKIPMAGGNTFLEINKNNSFAVSRTSGDLSGIYFVKNDRIRMSSKDKFWFNRDWIISRYSDRMIFRAIGSRKTQLKFRKIDRIPNFEEFASDIVGKWHLYKVRRDVGIEKISDTWFNIDDNGDYLISNAEGAMARGKVIINTRHRKMIFEQDSIIWNAWFYGKELRIDNPKTRIEYSLRKETP